MNKKKTVVLGASPNPTRYSHLAVQRLTSHGHPVVAIGKRAGKIDEVDIIADNPVIENVDTITLYMNSQNQKPFYNYMLSLHPKRVIFNPGAENDEFADLLKEKGIEPVEACTLVMLSTGQY